MNVKTANIEIKKCTRFMDYMDKELQKIDGAINDKMVELPAEMVSDTVMIIQEYKIMLENRQLEPWWK